MLIIGNQKNYMTTSEVNKFLKTIEKMDNVVICPSNIYIPYYLKRGFSVGLQNICCSNKTITGEISSKQAKSMGIEYAIIGHSERRENCPENDLGDRVNDALNYKINVVYCIGESLYEKDKNLTFEVLKEQIGELVKVGSLENVIIAYEPVWAIGTGIIPTNDEINTNVEYIKKIIKELYNQEVKVLYGGSVNQDNIETLKSISLIDGFLIGKASTNVEEFTKIWEVVRK